MESSANKMKVIAAQESRVTDPCLDDAREALTWYTAHARRARVAFQGLEVFQIAAGAFIPLAAAVHSPVPVTASLGAAIAVGGGLRSAFRIQANWINWSIAAAKIQREIALYKAQSAPYSGQASGQLLVRTVANLQLAETIQWASETRSAQEAVAAKQRKAS